MPPANPTLVRDFCLLGMAAAGIGYLQLLHGCCRNCFCSQRCGSQQCDLARNDVFLRCSSTKGDVTRASGKPGVLRAAPESVALGNGTNNVSTPSVAHGAPERPAERL